MLPHHDGAGQGRSSSPPDADVAPPMSPDDADVANAAHLDDLESSDKIHDISSFQEIDLPPPPHINDSVGQVDDDNRSVCPSVVEGLDYRRAKKYYYLLPLARKYKFWILGFSISASLLILAVGLSARAVITSNDDDGGEGRGRIYVSDSPPLPPPPTHDDSNDDYTVPIDVVGDDETGETVSSPSSSSSSSSSLSSSKSRAWFQRTSVQYSNFLETMLQEAGTIDEANLAGEFCDAQDMTLCGYDDYCPNGRGHDPYPGGPIDEQIEYWGNALEESQWAPYSYRTSTGSIVDDGDWVQVGTISEEDGGGQDLGYGRCYTYAFMISNPNTIQSKIEDAVAEDHRVWILCCGTDQ
ncbi:hypothetical protein ACHAXA_001126 [Cyclostephanos tholiformis]|uniref:DUF7495 domain-containing protein n=1 Tax=Cyclostephanos tholiformis TaxID=382380 RepID=A0ABD3R7T4_9STRA